MIRSIKYNLSKNNTFFHDTIEKILRPVTWQFVLLLPLLFDMGERRLLNHERPKNMPIENAPLLLVAVDDLLTCRQASRVWCARLGILENDSTAVPLAERLADDIEQTQ